MWTRRLKKRCCVEYLRGVTSASCPSKPNAQQAKPNTMLTQMINLDWTALVRFNPATLSKAAPAIVVARMMSFSGSSPMIAVLQSRGQMGSWVLRLQPLSSVSGWVGSKKHINFSRSFQQDTIYLLGHEQTGLRKISSFDDDTKARCRAHVLIKEDECWHMFL